MDELQLPLFPDRIRQVLNGLDRFILRLAGKPQNSFFLVLLLIFFVNGFRSSETDYFHLSQSPFEPYWGAAYVQDSIFLPLSAYYLGLNQSQIQFDTYTVCAFILALLVVYIFGYRRFRPELPLFLGLTLAASPVSLVAFAWPGMPDAFTVLFSVIVVFSNSIIILFFAALLGVSNHPQFVFIAIAIGILRLAAREKDFKVLHAVALTLGIIMGFGLVQAFLSYHQIHIEPSRIQLIFEEDLSFWLESKIIEAPLGLFSLYRGLWFVLPVCLLYGFSRNKPYYITFLGLQFAAAGLTLFVLDTTRIFSLLTIGTILHGVAFTYNSIEKEYRQSMRWLLAVLFIAAMFLPNYVMIMGQMYTAPTSLIPYFIFSLIFLG